MLTPSEKQGMKRIDENHSFNINVACAVGDRKALLLKELYGWCLRNHHNQKNTHFGLPWTYNSTAAFAEKFKYWSAKSIGRWLRELEEDGLVLSSNFNKVGFDKTKWYTVNFEAYDHAVLTGKTDKNKQKKWSDKIRHSIAQNEESKDQSGQSVAQNEEPIPSLTFSNTSLTQENAHENFLTEEEINELNSRSNEAPPSSAPPPQAEQATDEDPLLKIENETVWWLENDYVGKSKWRTIERSTGASPGELDQRKVVQAALSVCGEYVLSKPRIIRNKLLGCAATQLKIQRQPKTNARRNNQATVKPIQKQSNADYYAQESWGC